MFHPIFCIILHLFLLFPILPNFNFHFNLVERIIFSSNKSHEDLEKVGYRIKLFLKNNVKFLSGEYKLYVEKKKLQMGKVGIFLHIKTFHWALGYISENFSGRVVLKLTNYNSKSVKLTSRTPIGYLVFQSHSLN